MDSHDNWLYAVHCNLYKVEFIYGVYRIYWFYVLLYILRNEEGFCSSVSHGRSVGIGDTETDTTYCKFQL